MISRHCTFWDNLDLDPSNRTLNMNILNHIKWLTFSGYRCNYCVKKGMSFIFIKNIFSNVFIDSWWGNNTQEKFYWQKSDIRNALFGKFVSKPISGTLNRGQRLAT